jgi:hypothetical protein
MNDKPPLHINTVSLFCNRCNRWVDKYRQTLVIDGEVHCLKDLNWLCGEYDAFGNQNMSPSIQRITLEQKKHLEQFHLTCDLNKKEAA